MLDIDIQPSRGILFVRLSGVLDRKSTDKLNREVINFLKQAGIKNIVFNIEGLEYIDKYGKNALVNSFKICKSNKGQSFICISDNENISSQIGDFLKKVNIVKDELSAVNLINS